MFYEYHQNNSGGVFSPPAINVIVEANSASEADDIARSNGLYFDGVENEIDCPCCGDRWYSQNYGFNSDGDEVPSHYGKPIGETKDITEASYEMYLNWAREAGIPLFIVFYKDGRVETQ